MIDVPFLSTAYETGFEIGDILYRDYYGDKIAEWKVIDLLKKEEYTIYQIEEVGKNSSSLNFLVSIDPDCQTFFRNKEELKKSIALTKFHRLKKSELIRIVENKFHKPSPYFFEYIDLYPERFV
jgi:hypothetical protein